MSARALVTGAGAGLGAAVSAALAREGYHVLCSDLREDAANATAEQLHSEGLSAEGLALDVRSRDQLEHTAQSIGELSVLVNNAGIGTGGSLAQSSFEDIEAVLAVNLSSVMFCTKAFLPSLSKGGHVVNIASYAGYALMPGMIGYNVAKAGVIAFSTTLRRELAPDGIGVTVVCPGFFRTNLLDRFRSPNPDHRALVEKLMARSSFSAEDVAEAVTVAIRKGTKEVILPPEAARFRLIQRLFPSVAERMITKRARGWRS